MAAERERPPSVMRQQRQRKIGARRDPNHLVASAALMTGANRSKAKLTQENWQPRAWEMFDKVPEGRFGVGWLANALSRVNLFAAIPPQTGADEPRPIDLEADPALKPAVDFVADIAGGPAGQGQLMAGCTKQLLVPGLGYIHAKAGANDTYDAWSVLSNEEAQQATDGTGRIEVANPETGSFEPVDLERDLLIKVWRSHPRRRHQPDSPYRGLLSVLARIELLSLRIDATARSGLTGNGLLIFPESVEFPPGQGQDPDSETDNDADLFIETFVQVATAAESDPTIPGAKVPLVVKVPDETVEHVQHIKFYGEFDAALQGQLDAAVRRLATGLDTPVEVLLGMADMNHWNGWLVAEDTITMQIEPLAETICYALTEHYLKPALEAAGIDRNAAIVWYDTSDLTARPDHSAAATKAHDDLDISDSAYLGYVGLNTDDAPEPDEKVRRIVQKLALAATDPMQGLALLAAFELIDQAKFEKALGVLAELSDLMPAPAMSQAPATPAAPAPADDTGARTPPERPAADEEQPPADDGEDLAASAALVAAADGLVVRALEIAGNRLRSAAGKGRGGAAAVACQDPVTLHTTMPATEFASIDALLAGAWDRVPRVADRHGVSADSLTAALDGYARGLIAAQAEHDIDRLSAALGAG